MEATERRTYSTRLSVKIMDRMHELAAAHNRTLAGELEWALRQYVALQDEREKRGSYPTADQLTGIAHIIAERGERES